MSSTLKEPPERIVFPEARYPDKYNKMFHILKTTNTETVSTIIYNEKQYALFKVWFKESTNKNADLWLERYSNPEPGQKYTKNSTDLIFPVCISLGDTGHIGHQGATKASSFKKVLKEYQNYKDLDLDIILNLEKYPEYTI